MTTSRRGFFGMLAAAPVAAVPSSVIEVRPTREAALTGDEIREVIRRGVEAGMAQANAQMRRDLSRRMRDAQRRYGIG